MAQTKRKRQTKHRGNAAGVVETRGRTGRKPDDSEKGKKPDGKQARIDKLNTPPTWRSAINRSAIATVIFVALVLVAFHQKPAAAIGLAAFVFLFYIPLGYYTDLLLYRRRMKKLGMPDATKQPKPAAPKKKG
jgi:hypothetical protein